MFSDERLNSRLHRQVDKAAISIILNIAERNGVIREEIAGLFSLRLRGLSLR